MKNLIIQKFFKKRLFLVNFFILISLSCVIIKNLKEIRFAVITDQSGQVYILDRLTSNIKVID